MPPRCRPLLCLKRCGHAWLAALLLALLCSQSVGLLHRIVHAVALEQSRGPGPIRAGEQAGSPGRLFAAHTAAYSLCLVLDQISHSSPLPATPVSADAAPVRATLPMPTPTGRLFSSASVPFEARGPPLQS